MTKERPKSKSMSTKSRLVWWSHKIIKPPFPLLNNCFAVISFCELFLFDGTNVVEYPLSPYVSILGIITASWHTVVMATYMTVCGNKPKWGYHS